MRFPEKPELDCRGSWLFQVYTSSLKQDIMTQMLTKSGKMHVVSALSEKGVSEALQLSPQAGSTHASTDPQLYRSWPQHIYGPRYILLSSTSHAPSQHAAAG